MCFNSRSLLSILLLNFLFFACNLGSTQEDVSNQANNNSNYRVSLANDIVCFVYHRFGDDRYPSTNIAIDTFKKQLAFLKNQDFTVWPLGKAVKKLKNGAEIPKKTAVITIDDAYKTFISGAVPLLKEYNYPATLFVNTQTIGGGSFLNWDDLKRLKKQGIEIGNHSHAHAHFLDMKAAARIKRFKEDTRKAQKSFKAHLGEQPDLYAYPYGEYTPKMQEALKQMGFKAAAAQRSGVLHSGNDYFSIPRFPMGSSYATIKGFREKLGMGALKVTKQQPASPLITNNEMPELTFQILNEDVNPKSVQCFVDDTRNCDLTVVNEAKKVVKVKGTESSETRRSKYTITAPSTEGDHWYWYSHLWVFQGRSEPK